MKVLVTGAGGFLGRHVVDRLLERGHRVRAVIRAGSALADIKYEVELFSADLRSHDNLVAAFDGIDAVLHLAAAYSVAAKMRSSRQLLSEPRGSSAQ